MKNIQIAEINLAEYLLQFADLRTALSDFYVKTKDCRIIGAFDETRKSAGFLLAEENKATDILFLTAADQDTDIKKQLLEYLTCQCPPDTCLRWRIIEHPEDESVAVDCGFRCKSTLYLFRSSRYNTGRVCRSFMQRIERLYASVEKRGYRTVSFSELTEEQKEQIRSNPCSEFAPWLHPEKIMDDAAGGVSDRLSTAAVKDGKVAAYSVIRCPGSRRCIFEILCSAESGRYSGAVILPIVRSIHELLNAGYDSLTFAVSDKNKEMLSMSERIFSPVIESMAVQHNMIFYPVFHAEKININK